VERAVTKGKFIAADVSAVTGRLSTPTANTVKR
jgi:hypothetical protein